ncbi:alpha/beta hydrolase family protein [Paenibacillus sp. DMB20]|uniref:alpha/beta hydrolase family protein n=1 Tax=Paenibacillus sp. DMB20 TaxID=1642570 RepID=UPI0006280218|nr:hypothetical protein [Paenibacillus sp. DMB20]KKO54861.1 hypothetical protein XI25_03920 [Paenibacillus sp. DMB20]
MRIFEMLLAGACLILLNYLVFFRKPASKTGTTAVLGTMVLGLLVAQLFAEGYRWQMAFIYGIAVMLLIWCAVRSLRTAAPNAAKPRKWLRYSLYTAGMVFLAASVLLSVVVPVFRLPEPSGKYQVGVKDFHLVDPDREETFTDDPGDRRELMVRVWYPAEADKKLKQATLFPEDGKAFDKLMEAYSGGLGVPTFFLDYFKYIGANGYKEAKVLRGTAPYPVVIISHGMGTGTWYHTAQAENLASHGYVVAVIDHTYSTMVTIFPDGRTTGFKTEIDENAFYEDASRIGKVWTEDVGFVIEQLERMNSGDVSSGLEGTLDMRHIGAMGHSFGGATAFNAAYLNDKVLAGINMDGSLYELKDRKQMDKPFLFMRVADFMDAIEQYKKQPDADRQLLKNISEELSIMDEVSRKKGDLLLLKGAGHYNFTDLQLFPKFVSWMGMTGKIDGQRGAQIVNRYVLDFFNKHLKGIESTLLNGPDEAYPEVEFYAR